MAGSAATVFDRRPDIAALVNGALMVVVPMILAATLPVLFPTDAVVVRPPDAPVFSRMVKELAQIGILMLPAAFLAGWRTRVHAIAWCERGSTGWRGVIEGGIGGFLIAFLILLPASLRRPLDAPPYVIAYGGAALMLGFVIAFFLRVTALIVLRLSTPGSRRGLNAD
jgi:hypothetical protein